MAVTCTRNVQVIVRCGVITVYYLSVLCSGSDKVPPPLRLETISVRNGPCPVSRKPPPESYVPGDNLTWGSRRNQLRRGHGSPPVLSEVPHELSIPMRTPKSANGPRSNSFRPDSPSTTNLPRGRKTQTAPLTTPDMVRSGRVLRASVKSPSVKSL
ncbi:Uncharacterised protein [[Clostridium] symbiosum]|jgi:hypothetical protein|uniref:Uncharacterized protein n=1 Tax=Clostridium symbiosum TaxID=1512 RepID=A0A6N3H1L9_CLOSY